MKKSLNQCLAENLERLLIERKLSANVLGPRANVSPNTINNYLRLKSSAEPAVSAKGKEKSAKLTEIERIASALRVPALSLLQISGVEEKMAPSETTDDRLTEELREVFRTLPRQNQLLLLSLAVALKSTDA